MTALFTVIDHYFSNEGHQIRRVNIGFSSILLKIFQDAPKKPYPDIWLILHVNIIIFQDAS